MFVSKKILSGFFVYLTIFLLPFSWIELPGLGSLFRFYIPLSGLVFIFVKKRSNFCSEEKNLFIIWLFFVLYLLISFFWSDNVDAGYLNLNSSVIILIILFVFYYSTEINSLFLEKTWIFTSVFLFIIFCFGGSSTIGIHERKSIQLFGTYTDANEFAFVYVLTFPLIVKQILSTSKMFYKALSLFAVLCFFYIFFITGSRGALLSVMFETIIISFLNRKHIKYSFLYFIFLPLLLISITYFIIPYIPESTLDRLTLSSIEEDEATGRFDIWEQSVKSYFESSPFDMLFGKGNWGTKTIAYGNVTSTLHNTALQFLLDYGLIGLFTYIVLYLKLLRRSHRICPYLYCSLIGSFIQSLTITLSFLYKPFWVYLISLSFVSLNTTDSQVGE